MADKKVKVREHTRGKPKRSKKATPRPKVSVRAPKVKIPRGQGSLF